METAKKSKRPYNYYSKSEDNLLKDAMFEVLEYAEDNYPLPYGWHYELWNRLSNQKIHDKLINYGVSKEFLSFLLEDESQEKKNYSIQPDAGILVAVKKDIGGNLIDFYILLTGESKHQESAVGNAIERFSKNYNVLKALTMNPANGVVYNEIFPYICFCQGVGFSNPYIVNKVAVSLFKEPNSAISAVDVTDLRGTCYVRVESWKKNEIYPILLDALRQSYGYYKAKFWKVA